ISPTATAYNLPSVGATVLPLSPDTVAAIFAHQLGNWTDPNRAADNPSVGLPDPALNPARRSDQPGTSAHVPAYLAPAAPALWTWGSIEVWDEGPGGGEGAEGTSGVVAAIRAGEGSIGYAGASQIGDLPAAAVGVGGGFVRFSPEAAGRIVDSSERVSS